MAWSSPRTWNTGDIVTAAQLNTELRDNLNYLKGNSGLVNLASSLDTTGVLRATGATSPPTGAGTELIYVGGTGYLLAYDRSAAGFRPLIMAGTTLEWDVASTPAMMLDANRNLGIGTMSPQGRLHGYDTISGFIHWKYDGVDGTVRTIVPDGTGDCLYLLRFMSVVRCSDGTRTSAQGEVLNNGIFDIASNQTLGTPGSDTLRLRVNTNGSIDIFRNTGTTYTFKVGLWLLWL